MANGITNVLRLTLQRRLARPVARIAKLFSLFRLSLSHFAFLAAFISRGENILLQRVRFWRCQTLWDMAMKNNLLSASTFWRFSPRYTSEGKIFLPNLSREGVLAAYKVEGLLWTDRTHREQGRELVCKLAISWRNGLGFLIQCPSHQPFHRCSSTLKAILKTKIFNSF